MKAKQYELEIGKPVEMLGAPRPQMLGRDMTIGDMIVQMVPSLASRETDKAVRLWRIATSIDACTEQSITIEDLDFQLLKSVLLSSEERPVWVKVNLQQAFTDAESKAEGQASA
jgi:hypothetical protein